MPKSNYIDGKWYKISTPNGYSPPTRRQLENGIKAEVQPNGKIGGEKIKKPFSLKNSKALDVGTNVYISLFDGKIGCMPTELYKREQKAKKAEKRADARKRQIKQTKRRQQRKEEREKKREQFWNQYRIPINFNTATNARISQLKRGSSGTGETKNTKVHLLVLEDFQDGRLKRQEGDFLCRNSGKGKYSDLDGRHNKEPVQQKTDARNITCKTCLKRMKRWKETDN